MPKNIRLKAAIQIYIAWNIWKEPSRRVFDGKRVDKLQVVIQIKEEMALWRRACGQAGVVLVYY